MDAKEVYKLPVMEHRFTINAKGNDSQVNYLGDFVYKRPTIAERSLIEQMRVRMNGDLKTIDEDIALNNEALSWLRFTLKEFPEWWKSSQYGANLHDENILIEVYNQVIQFEAGWRKKVYGGNAQEVVS